MGMQANPMLMQKLMQLRQGQQPQGANMMPTGGGNPNVPAMPQMNSSMPQQNPAAPMQPGMQSMAPQDPMLARKLMMMRQGAQGMQGAGPNGMVGQQNMMLQGQ